MNVILTATVTFNGTIATTSTSFETTDEPGCTRTAHAVLGADARKEGVEWVVVKDRRGGQGTIHKTVVCFPRQSGEKTDE
jgi:hypothetical protein